MNINYLINKFENPNNNSNIYNKQKEIVGAQDIKSKIKFFEKNSHSSNKIILPKEKIPVSPIDNHQPVDVSELISSFRKKPQIQMANKGRKRQRELNIHHVKNYPSSIKNINNINIAEFNKRPRISLRQSIHKLKFPQSQFCDEACLKPVNLYEFVSIDEGDFMQLQQFIKNGNPKYNVLGLDKLKGCNLLPTNTIKIANANYHVSNLFTYTHNNQSHDLALAFIEIQEQEETCVYPRVFYHSNSQATWRVLPFAAKDLNGKFCWYGKGLREIDTQLPIPLTVALNSLYQISEKIIDFSYEECKEKGVNISNLVKSSDRYCSNSPSFLNLINFGSLAGNDDTNNPRAKMANRLPENSLMPIDDTLHPDFSIALIESTLFLPHYGQVTCRVFNSYDESLSYLFIEASDGLAYLACVESNLSPINKYGVRSHCIDFNTSCSPLLEYFKQIPKQFRRKTGSLPGQEDPHSYETKLYGNQWNFVRKLPVIEDYYFKFKKTRIPKTI